MTINNLFSTITPKKCILLTGAGFTHNFSGPLASSMWSEIFNSVHLRPHARILALLRGDFDFESAYHHVIQGEFTDPEKAAFESAIQEAYENLDSILRTSRFESGSLHPIHLYGLQKFISEFAGSRGQPGFIFTLNQDLFLERKYYPPVGSQANLVLPGVRPPTNVRWFESTFNQQITPSLVATLPAGDQAETRVMEDVRNQSFCYIKPHGSYGWRKPDGSACFVIGQNKERTIFADPVLKLYFQIFEQVVSQGDRRLLVIGYGFGDVHINAALAKAVKEHGLGLYILCPTEQARFHENLIEQKYGGELWAGLHGYFPYTLRQLFPESQDNTVAAKQLHDCLFV